MRRWLALLGALVIAIAACGSSTPSRPPEALRPADPERPAKIITPGADTPNPFVVVDGDRHLLYASQMGIFHENVQLRIGRTRERYGPVRDAMPELPAWVQRGFTWAPDVREVDGRWVMWFTAATKFGRTDGPRLTQCIGVAIASSPLGPFRAIGDGPAICQLDRWGSIDPRTFRDADGQLWLHWKSDDNAEVDGVSHSSIYAQRLDDDGITLEGTPRRILEADQAWEGRIVEAPQMVLVEDRYWLFYSGNWFNQPAYGIGVAECEGPTGPCRKPHGEPWLGSNAQGIGPGECSLFEDDDGWWIVYGPWAVEYEDETPRPAALARVGFDDDGPYLAAFPS